MREIFRNMDNFKGEEEIINPEKGLCTITVIVKDLNTNFISISEIDPDIKHWKLKDISDMFRAFTIVTVIVEYATSGIIYQWGNIVDTWQIQGFTMGYA